MGLRFRKSIKILPGVRLNLNKKSTSLTFGPKGLKHTISSTGRKTTTVGLPGTGLYYTESTSNNKNHKVHENSQEHNSEIIENEYTVMPPSAKDRNVALWLCLLFGFAGIHRFYLGKIGTGVFWLCTGGCFVYGWIFDIIAISRGKFKDKYGCIL